METQIHFSQEECLYLATRMESRATALYEQAMLAFALGELKPVLQSLLAQENEHLRTFTRLLGEDRPIAPQRMRELEAEAGEALFGDGLEGAVREGAFDSAVSLLLYAADEEERSASRYTAFARASQGEAQKAFVFIARQEELHLKMLQDEVKARKSRLDG